MRDFLEMKQELITEGRTFSAADLTLLSYQDVKRAAIGDAGAAACAPELVHRELTARLDRYDHVTPAMFPGFTRELEHLGMYADVYRRVFPSPPAAMDWASLPTALRAYFLVRCLRAHVDQPGPRLMMLESELDHLAESPRVPQEVSDIARVLHGTTTALRSKVGRGEVLDIESVRRKFNRFDILLTGCTPVERAAVLTLTLRGYHCSSGCFLPAEIRPHD